MRNHWFQMVQDNIDMHITAIKGNPIDDFHTKNSVTEAIMKLNVNDRKIIVLYYYQELPIKEIAGIIGKTQNADRRQRASIPANGNRTEGNRACQPPCLQTIRHIRLRAQKPEPVPAA